MQVSAVMKSLERKALIQRMTAPGYGPAKTVAPTPGGIAALRIALPLMVEVQSRLFGPEGRPGGGLLQMLLSLDRASQPALR